MGVFSYTAVDRGSLVNGHSEGGQYQIEIPFSEWTPRNKEKKVVKRSLSGKPHTTFHNRQTLFSFSTIPTDDPAILEQLDELFASVAGGETFSIDVYGTIATPHNPVTAFMVGPVANSRSNQTELEYRGQVEKL